MDRHANIRSALSSAKAQRRYRAYMKSQMDCGGDGCGYCRVCRRLEFLEWVGQVAPRDIPCTVSPDFDVDNYIKRHYPGAI